MRNWITDGEEVSFDSLFPSPVLSTVTRDILAKSMKWRKESFTSSDSQIGLKRHKNTRNSPWKKKFFTQNFSLDSIQGEAMTAFDKKGHLQSLWTWLFLMLVVGHNKGEKENPQQLISCDNMINSLICHEFRSQRDWSRVEKIIHRLMGTMWYA